MAKQWNDEWFRDTKSCKLGLKMAMCIKDILKQTRIMLMHLILQLYKQRRFLPKISKHKKRLYKKSATESRILLWL